jgi:hypothetical protein
VTGAAPVPASRIEWTVEPRYVFCVFEAFGNQQSAVGKIVRWSLSSWLIADR